MSDASEKLNYDTDLAEDERLALAAANAIQRLIAERNALRDQAADQKRELLRVYRQVALIRDSYRRLTLEFVTQLQHIDSIVAGVFPILAGLQVQPTPAIKAQKTHHLCRAEIVRPALLEFRRRWLRPHQICSTATAISRPISPKTRASGGRRGGQGLLTMAAKAISLGNMQNGDRLLVATAAFRNEPFQPPQW